MKRTIINLLVVTALLLLNFVSNANAINLLQNKSTDELLENNYDNIEGDIYVDPNIYLSDTYLPKLKRAFENIEDQQYKESMHKIILTIESKGYVDSNNLKEILIELNMFDTEVYTGMIVGSARYGSIAGGFPFLSQGPHPQQHTAHSSLRRSPLPELDWYAIMGLAVARHNIT